MGDVPVHPASASQCPEIGLRKSVKNADRTSLFREDVDIINRPPPPDITT